MLVQPQPISLKPLRVKLGKAVINTTKEVTLQVGNFQHSKAGVGRLTLGRSQ